MTVQPINEPTRITEHSTTVISHVMWKSRSSQENAGFTDAPQAPKMAEEYKNEIMNQNIRI